MIDVVSLLALNFAVLYIAGALYFPSIFVYKPGLIVAEVLFIALYLFFKPLVVVIRLLSNVPVLGWPFTKLRQLTVAVLAISVVINIADPIIEEMPKPEEEVSKE